METASTRTRIFSRTDFSHFVGRAAELHQLFDHSRGEGISRGLAVLAPPASGSTELLTQVYDQLFFEQESVIPFYYKVRLGDVTARAAASRFLEEFLTQTAAFRLRDPRLIGASPEIQEISELAAATDSAWIDNLIEAYQLEGTYDDERSFIRRCISSPMRAVAAGTQAFVMIDEIHNALGLEGGGMLLDEITNIFERSSIPVVFCGHRRFLFDRTKFPALRIEHLSFSEAGRLIEQQASALDLAISAQTRDLIAVQLGCSPTYISSFIASAHGSGAELTSFAATEQLYTDEMFGGLLSRRLDQLLDRIAPEKQTQAMIVELIKETIDAKRHRSPVARWRERLAAVEADFEALINALYHHEIINLGGSSVTFEMHSILIKDYIEARTLLESDDRPRALIVGETTAENVKRAPQLMAQFYRKASSPGLLGLMKALDGRQVSLALMDYARYKNELKGVSREKALEAVMEDNSRMRLPNCVFSAHTSAYYPRLDEICESERSVTAICVTDETERSEEVWIAAEIDSKLEASRETAEFWCDRLEMVAVNCNFDKYRIWLVAAEGFDPDAMAALEERNAIGSSRAQAELLAELLFDNAGAKSHSAAKLYEFVVPMGDDTEMIAAHTVEDIARRHDFPSKTINQIKTALVEACINASEHSLSPDQRIYQTFSVEDEKITITVANRGLRFSEVPKEEPVTNGGRRGWGLKLIKSLMDEVWVESVDDGTRVTMVKYVRRPTEMTV
jgi:serine/threonine-protein kinase RsbW